MTGHHHPESASAEADSREHSKRVIRSYIASEMKVDVRNRAAAPIGGGEMAKWACTGGKATDEARVRAATEVAIAGEVKTRPYLRIPGTVWALIAFASVSLVFAGALALLGSTGLAVAFGGLAAIFASLAVVLELAAMPGIRAWFRCKYCSWRVETTKIGAERRTRTERGALHSTTGGCSPSGQRVTVVTLTGPDFAAQRSSSPSCAFLTLLASNSEAITEAVRSDTNLRSRPGYRRWRKGRCRRAMSSDDPVKTRSYALLVPAQVPPCDRGVASFRR